MTASMKIASLNESKMITTISLILAYIYGGMKMVKEVFEKILNITLYIWGVILLGLFVYSVGYAVYQIITNPSQFSWY